jgi:hypothetical protein
MIKEVLMAKVIKVVKTGLMENLEVNLQLVENLDPMVNLLEDLL